MVVIGNLLAALAKVINFVLYAYMWIIIARAVLSWVSPDPYNPIVRFVHNVTEPLLYQIRKRLPVSYSGIDFSPILVIVIIMFLQSFLVGSLADLSRQILYP